MIKKLLAALTLLLPLPAFALDEPDLNGYVAEYECRAGGPHCDVDVEGLAGPDSGCDQIITPSTPWENINWSNDHICIQAGDHRSKGVLSITASGSSGNYKVVRYYRAGDSNDDPWNQGENQARLAGIDLNGARFIIIHRLTMPAATSPEDRVFLRNQARDIILSRLLVEGNPQGTGTVYSAVGAWGCTTPTASNLTLQNSVIRNNEPAVGSDGVGIAIECGENVRLVNNEIYDWSSHPVQFGHNGIPQMAGIVTENNDIYFTSAFHVGDGEIAAEGTYVLKAYGTSDNPIRVIHNRIWGNRFTDTSSCCIGGTDGKAISLTPIDFDTDTFRWTLIQDNILFDNQKGIQWSFGDNFRTSVIGNIIWNHFQFLTSAVSSAIEGFAAGSTEVYLNTVINMGQHNFIDPGGDGNNDYRCNVLIDGGSISGNTSGATLTNNVFYATPSFGSSNVSRSVVTRANSTSYSIGTIMRRNSDPDSCTAENDADCFLYEAITAGTTAASPPVFATSLGDTFQDGTVTWRAIRGPKVVWHKLRTTPEQLVIPYAVMYVDAPEADFCPTAGEADAVGSRTGTGINDDVAPNGIFADITNPTMLNPDTGDDGGETPPPPEADANGYVALYECRAGNPNCDVDVKSIVETPCDELIENHDDEATAEAKVDRGQIICIEPGDYNFTLDINSSGTENNWKALVYFREGDNNDDPWDQSDGNRAKVLGLNVAGSFWIVHRLTFPASSIGPSPRIQSDSNSGNQIFSRILVEGGPGIGVLYYGYSQDCGDGSGYNNITWQNSVFRNLDPIGPQQEAIALDFQCGNNLRAVNNEIYDWVSHPIQIGHNNNPQILGTVVENNDFYFTNDFRSDCNGNFTSSGVCGPHEALIQIKHFASAANPTRIIHNRLWGVRHTDFDLCCNGMTGDIINLGNRDSAYDHYVLIQNNILMDSKQGISATTTGNSGRVSVIGNLLYTFDRWDGSQFVSFAFQSDRTYRSEWYLNTLIDVRQHNFYFFSDPNNDMRCNVLIDAGTRNGSPASSTQVDYNVFYNTTPFSFNATNTNIDKSVVVRANSTSYAAGTIMRRTSDMSQCTANDDADCFLYEAQNSGTTGAGEPTYSTELGGEFNDGSITWRAIRGPYTYFRKLRTGPELHVIPYARPHASAPEVNFCPGEGELNALGSLLAVGINDDVAPEGIFVADLAGTPRDPGQVPVDEVFRVIDSGTSANDTDTLITGVGNPTPGHLQFLVISNTNSEASWPDSVTGAGMVWEDLSHFHTFGNVAIAVWRADGTGAQDGALTISFPDPQFDFVWQWIEVTSDSWIGTNQSKSQVDAETNVMSLDFNFPIDDPDNLVLAVWGGGVPPATPGPNFELIENTTFFGQGYENSIATAWGRAGDMPASVTWADDGWRLSGQLFEIHQ